MYSVKNPISFLKNSLVTSFHERIPPRTFTQHFHYASYSHISLIPPIDPFLFTQDVYIYYSIWSLLYPFDFIPFTINVTFYKLTWESLYLFTLRYSLKFLIKHYSPIFQSLQVFPFSLISLDFTKTFIITSFSLDSNFLSVIFVYKYLIYPIKPYLYVTHYWCSPIYP